MEGWYVTVSIGFKGDLGTAVIKLIIKTSLWNSILFSQNDHNSNTDDVFIT